MTASDYYRDCFWCGYIYEPIRFPCCPECGSRLEKDGLGALAGEYNKKVEYKGPDLSAEEAAREERIAKRQADR